MTPIHHVAFVFAYALVALVVAFVLPGSFPALSADVFLILGGVVLVGGALVHESAVRARRQGEMRDHINVLAGASESVMNELVLARQETVGIRDALVGARGRKGGDAELEEVIGEVRVLQNIVEQLCDRVPLDDDPAGAKVTPLVARGLDEATMLKVLRDGLRGDRVDLFVQPVVSLPQRRHRFYECFSRIRSHDGSMVLPDQYIELAEKEGLITTLDNLLLFRCVQLVRKSQRNKFDVGFFCNISLHTLKDKAFFQDFIDFIADNAELAPSLIFEFSQSAFVALDGDLRAQLDRLAGLGFRFSLDQVTDLHLDLPALESRNVRFLKVDAAVVLAQVAQEDPDVDFRALQRSLVRFGVDLIVEKVEAEQTLVELLEFNIDYGQGYLFGVPRLSGEAATEAA
ncbi:MAG: EAL domain-containing protein [Alphaproteobacteria bacterium]